MLATSGLEFLQGIETPEENSTAVDSSCGQAATLTFYAELLGHAAAEPPQPLPVGNGAGAPWSKNLTELEFRHTWSWRRAYCAGNRSLDAVNVGDITQQNLGNDLDTAYLFPPLADVRAEARSTEGWRGGAPHARTRTHTHAHRHTHVPWLRRCLSGVSVVCVA